MKLEDNEFRYKNPNTIADLVIPIKLVPNTTLEKPREHFHTNIANNYQWLDESPVNSGKAIVCGASPSLKKHVEAIREEQANGAVIYGCNSAARFLFDNGISIDHQVILDASDLAIYDVLVSAKSHLFASIVNPIIFEMVDSPVLWHPAMQWIFDYLDLDDRKFTYIGGGITVSNSALCIAYTMGFRDITVYGMDSSYIESQFYANGAKPEEERLFIDLEINGKTFHTTYDMKQQVIVFLQLYQLLKDQGCKVDVFCDGLMAEAWLNKE